MKQLIFVTHSLDKFIEVERILGIKLKQYDFDLPEIQALETEEVAKYKVKYAYDLLGGQPVIVEDTGLFIEAWNGLPGALIKWFIKQVGDAGICKMMEGITNRAAWAETVVGTYDKEMRLFKGKVVGEIALAPAGERGFGWDKIFIPNGAAKTFGEMSPSEKDKYSMRRLAFEALKAYFS